MDLYHMLNRGVDKRAVILDDGDRLRFVQNLFIMNDENDAPHNLVSRSAKHWREEGRKPLVHIHAWCLMDNHYHLLVSPREDDPKKLAQFAKKLNMGYSKYFNEKYARVGALWQGKYRKILIERSAHFLYIPFYIHLNPLDMSHPGWRKGKVSNVERALQALRTYRWSSFLDYVGIHNFPSIIYTNLLQNELGTPRTQEKTIGEIIRNESLAKDSLSLD